MGWCEGLPFLSLACGLGFFLPSMGDFLSAATVIVVLDKVYGQMGVSATPEGNRGE